MSAIQQALFMKGAAAAGLTLVGFTTVSASSSGTVNKPAGTVSGDIVVIAGFDNSNVAAWSFGGGGTAFTDIQAGASNRMGMAWKVAGGSEPSTYFCTNSGTYTGVICATFRGPTAFDAAGAYTFSGAASSIAAPAVTAGSSSSVLIGAFAASGNVTWSTPAGMTAVGRSTEPSVTLFYQQLSSSGSTGTRTSTPSAGGYDLGAMMLTIKP